MVTKVSEVKDTVKKGIVNPYQGCSFNCIYCYTRGSKYGSHLAKNLSVKTNALELLAETRTGVCMG